MVPLLLRTRTPPPARVGAVREAAKQMAAQINGQLETGAPAALRRGIGRGG